MFTTCRLHAFYLKLKFVYFKKFDKIRNIDMVLLQNPINLAIIHNSHVKTDISIFYKIMSTWLIFQTFKPNKLQLCRYVFSILFCISNSQSNIFSCFEKKALTKAKVPHILIKFERNLLNNNRPISFKILMETLCYQSDFQYKES